MTTKYNQFSKKVEVINYKNDPDYIAMHGRYPSVTNQDITLHKPRHKKSNSEYLPYIPEQPHTELD